MAIYISVAAIEFMITNHGRVLYENEQNIFAYDTLMYDAANARYCIYLHIYAQLINASTSTYYV